MKDEMAVIKVSLLLVIPLCITELKLCGVSLVFFISLYLVNMITGVCLFMLCMTQLLQSTFTYPTL